MAQPRYVCATKDVPVVFEKETFFPRAIPEYSSDCWAGCVLQVKVNAREVLFVCSLAPGVNET